jgi:hypothetical protein
MRYKILSRLLLVMIPLAPLASCACAPPPPARPLDVVIGADGLDDNGYPLNPNWQSQLAQPGSFADPTKCMPTGSAQDDPNNWSTGPHPCTNVHVTTNRGAVCGPHVNWFPVTYQAESIGFENHSSFSYEASHNKDWGGFAADGDYNITLSRSDRALYTADKDPTGQLYCEFDSDETVDHFRTTWWNNFHEAVDNEDNNFAAADAVLSQNKGAIAVGLLGLDCGHDNCSVELHPIYILAIHLNHDPNHDRWVFFARNKGDEGYCSDPEENLFPPGGDNGSAQYTYKLLLPQPKAKSVNFLGKDVRIDNGHGDSADAGAAFSWSLRDNKGLLLSFVLPNPAQSSDDDDWVIEGDIELAWTLNP